MNKLTKKAVVVISAFFCVLVYAQENTTPDKIANFVKEGPTPAQQEKIDAALTVMGAVQKAGAYIESISDLMGNGELTLPVGIKKGDYELIIHKVKQNIQTGRPEIYASCAFKFKDNGQVIAFEGKAELQGQKGIGTRGKLELVAPVYRDLGHNATIGFQSGTAMAFGCEGIDMVGANMVFALTSENLYEVNQQGQPTGRPFTATFTTTFEDFGNYTASFRVDRSFAIKTLPEVFFTIDGVTLDQSDSITPTLAKFPQGYFTGDVEQERNLWKGVAITSATMALPSFFKAPETNEHDTLVHTNKGRIEVGMENTLIDNKGFTGRVLANGVIPGESINKSQWDISLDDLSFIILKNDITGFGFGGEINVPPFGKNSLMAYSATFNTYSKEYDFAVEIGGEYEFPALKSTLALHPSSTIELMVKGSGLYPAVVANGKLTVNAPLNEKDSTKKFSVPDITFQEMRIGREAPKFSVGALGVEGNLRTPKVAGFELHIDSIKSFENDFGSGLRFTTGVKLNDMFGGNAGILLYGDYEKWKFREVEISSIDVHFESKAITIDGGVMFKNGDAIYGSGFRGDLSMRLIDKFQLDAVGVFGKVDDYRYFLTDVFFETSPATGIPFGPLSFYGFGGGLYRHMQQNMDASINSSFAESLSGMQYIPDREVGMGFFTSTKFALTGSSSAFNALLTFEMQFNRHGGVNFIQLRGDGSFMDSPEKWGKLTDNISQKTKALEDKLNAGGGKLKVALKSDLSVPENKQSGFLTASMNLKYDIANSVFTADLSTYLNAGPIKGVGPNDRMGWASAYFSKDKWYTYIGTPTDPLGIKIFGLAEARSYFMVGDDIPELPPPPAKVLKNFGPGKQAKLNTRNTRDLASGSGLAFGAGLEVGFDATLPPFYAQVAAGLGADFMLKNYGASAYCAGGSGTLGINGWYARAQAWAYIEADIGMEARLFGKNHQLSILDISAGALLRGAGPNPFYLQGMVGGHFSVMGGLVSGQCDFDFEIGEECIIKGGSPFGEEIIAQLTPGTGDKDVNVFTAPQAIFNIPIGLEMEIEEGEGKKAMYKVNLDKFEVRYANTKAVVEGHTELSSDGRVYAIDPSEPFESKANMEVYAKVSFQRKLNGQWVTVKGDDGKPVYEEKTESFVSGDRPKTIMPKHVKHSYPMPRQYNFYPDEHEAGYIHVTENYAYLFSTEKPEGFKQLIRVADKTGNTWETPFTYKANAAGNDIRLEIAYPLKEVAFANNEVYQIGIINVPVNTGIKVDENISQVVTKADSLDISVTTQKAEGTIARLQEKEIYAHHFRTSKYNTFAQKMGTYNTVGSGWRDWVEPFVHDIKANITDDEYFDKYEIQWMNGDFPMVRFEAQLDGTRWFKNSFYQKMYDNHSGESIKDEREGVDPDFNKLGFPPAMAVEIQNPTNDRLLKDDEVNTGVPTGTFAYGNFTYALPYWCARDFYYIKEEIAKKAARGQGLQRWETEILANDFPPVVEKGKYPLKVYYVLPGTDIKTTTLDIEMYNPID